MKNTFPPFAKLIAVAACALTLGSCSRAEYAMLPQGASYHGVNRAATPVPTQPEATATVAATPDAVAPETVPAASVAATAPAPAAKPKVAARKVAAAPAAPAVAQTAPAVATTAPKLNAFQRLALNKVTRKVDKLMQRSTTVRQHDNTASTSAINGNLRTGIILLLIGLIVGIFSSLIGGIIALIGLIFIVLWLLDNL